MEAWTDEGDWASTETITEGNYVINLFPGNWHGGPALSPWQEDNFVVLPPQRRHGHLEANETLIDAAIRETLEETAWRVDITAVLGLALYTTTSSNVTFYRTSFIATPIEEVSGLELDDGIDRALWMSYQEILQNADRMRSPLVIKTIEQYLSGHRYPLDLIYNN